MFTSFTKAAAPLALAVAVTLTTLAPADASQRSRARNAGIIGALVGAAAVGVLATRPRRVAPPVYVAPRPVYVAPRPVYVAPRHGGGWAGHVNRCYAAYRSYDERSDTYQPYSGPRRRCTK